MDTDSRIEADLKALADASGRGLPTIDQTARAVADARAQRSGGSIMSLIRKPMFATAAAVAVVAAVLVCPVPYTRTVGYTVQRVNGTTRVVPRTKRVWGTVYAAVKQKLLTLHVDTDGKTDEQIADDVRAQMGAQGWTADDVQVQRTADSSSLEIDGADGNGHKMKIVRKASGGPDHAMDIEVGGLDETREDGMTDAQLRDKILKQLKERGLDGDVVVDGNRIEIRASRQQTVDE
jgi:hypothetical protein